MQTITELHLPDKNAKLVSLHKKQLQSEDISCLLLLPAPSQLHLNLSCSKGKNLQLTFTLLITNTGSPNQ